MQPFQFLQYLSIPASFVTIRPLHQIFNSEAIYSSRLCKLSWCDCVSVRANTEISEIEKAENSGLGMQILEILT